VADEKLAAGRVGMGRARHGEDAPPVRLGIEFRLEAPARAARSWLAGRARLRIRTPTLDHETLDDAVKRRAVVVAVAGEFFEVLDRLWGDIGPEGDGDFTVTRS